MSSPSREDPRYPVASPAEHVPAIDRVKGLAILFVVAIHSRIAAGTTFHDQLINRAVPIFLLVFGLNSELSFARLRAAGGSVLGWYRARLGRLYPPLLAQTTLWLVAVWITEGPPYPMSVWEVLLALLGYAPWIGPGWFVTVVIQFILVFPALHWAVRKLGPWVVLPATATICCYTAWHVFDVIWFGEEYLSRKVPGPGWYYFWIFLPRVLWPVMAGQFVARFWGPRLGLRVTVIAVLASLLVLPAVWIARSGTVIVSTLQNLVVMHFFDVPVAVAVLGLCSTVPLPRVLARPLEWCGRASWGLYLGHALIFEVMHLYGNFPEAGPFWMTWLYGASLLSGGLVLALAGDFLRRKLRFRKPGPSAP